MNKPKTWRFQRATRTHVWIINSHYGYNPPRGCSRRIDIETFQRDYIRLPQREVMLREDYAKLQSMIGNAS